MTPSTPPLSPASAPSLLHCIRSATEPVGWTDLFPKPHPLELELGAGDGSFLLRYAAAHPERNFVGVERLAGRLSKIDRKGRRLGLVNLRAIRFEAAYLLRYLIPSGELEAIHVYFPDPWPKLKHRHYRLVNDDFPALAARSLRPGGVVHLRTDDADYFAQMQRVFAASPRFEPVPTPSELLAIRTYFEEEFNARGITTLHASYRFGR